MLGRNRIERNAGGDRLAGECCERAVTIEITLVSDRDGSLDGDERRRVRGKRPSVGPDARPFQNRRKRAGAFLQVVRGDVQDEEDTIRAVHEVRKVGLRVVLRHGRRVHELHLDILERHHPGKRRARGEWIGRDLGVRMGQRAHERRFPRVRRPDQDPLPRALPGHVPRIEPLGSAAPRHRPFLLELRDSVLQVRLHLLGAFVLGQQRQHLAQHLELFGVRGRLAESLLRLLVLRRQIRGHPLHLIG